MITTELAERLEALEMRYAHQEAALEELTRTVLAQEQLIRLQGERLGQLQHSVRAMQGGAGRGAVDERPPHY
jgi:SlyX protein